MGREANERDEIKRGRKLSEASRSLKFMYRKVGWDSPYSGIDGRNRNIFRREVGFQRRGSLETVYKVGRITVVSSEFIGIEIKAARLNLFFLEWKCVGKKLPTMKKKHSSKLQ